MVFFRLHFTDCCLWKRENFEGNSCEITSQYWGWTQGKIVIFRGNNMTNNKKYLSVVLFNSPSFSIKKYCIFYFEIFPVGLLQSIKHIIWEHYITTCLGNNKVLVIIIYDF